MLCCVYCYNHYCLTRLVFALTRARLYSVLVDKHGLPVCRIKGNGGTLVTNAIFGGPNNDILYFTDSLNGNVYSHQWHCKGATPIRQSRAKTNPFQQAGHLQPVASDTLQQLRLSWLLSHSSIFGQNAAPEDGDDLSWCAA